MKRIIQKKKIDVVEEEKETLLEVNNLYKKYDPKGDYTIQDISLYGKAGEIVAILGHNGAGKSTTIKSITGMHPYDQGKILICNNDLKLNPIEAKKNFGYVSDEFTLFEKMTGFEFVNFMADIYGVSEEDRKNRIESFQKIFLLGKAIYNQISSYSHGMKQKISIMGALIHNPKVFILDVDGVLTDGCFYYSQEGKVLKKFGPDDNDALKLLAPYIEIRFVSGDKRGFSISKARVDDMHFPIDLVSTTERIDWIKERYNPAEVIYMGDGIFDAKVMSQVAYSIATISSDKFAKDAANYVTEREGAHRAVAEACIHILDKFFKPYNP